MTEPEWRSGFDRRLEKIEASVSQLQISAAVMAAEIAAGTKNTSETLKKMSDEQKSLRSSMLWPQRIIMAAALGALAQFMIRGGFAP